MSLNLDARQRAMLQEMGVHVWWPQIEATAAVEVDAGAVAALPSLPTPATAPVPATSDIERLAVAAVAVRGGITQQEPSAPVVGLASRAEVGDTATMAWTELAQTIATCQACMLGVGRRSPVFQALPSTTQADWLVVGDPPEDAEERAGFAFTDQVGQLLDNMLKAVGVTRLTADVTLPPAQAAYLTQVVKCRPALPRAPQPQDLAACEPYLKREIALVKPKVILALGRVAAQILLGESDPQLSSMPLGKLRGHVYHYQGVPVVVSYPPSYLLRTQQDKARAWADLCLAMSVARPAQE